MKKKPFINWDALAEMELDPEDVDLIDIEFTRAIKSLSVAGMGQKGYDHLASMGIMKPLTYFFENFNPSNNAPYHNAYHTRCMVLNVFEAGAYYEMTQSKDLLCLMIAALFHDFDHTAGHEPDEVNIKRALVGLDNAIKYARSQGFYTITPGDYETIVGLIRITKYPYEAEPSTPLEGIIRDADLMQPYEEDPVALVKQFDGLRQELEVRMGPISEGYAEKLHAWYKDNARWYTSWGVAKAKVLNFEARLDNLKELLERN